VPGHNKACRVLDVADKNANNTKSNAVLTGTINKEMVAGDMWGYHLGRCNLQQRNPDFFNVASEREALRAERNPRESQALLVHSSAPPPPRPRRPITAFSFPCVCVFGSS
jgi:hypothetical protein